MYQSEVCASAYSLKAAMNQLSLLATTISEIGCKALFKAHAKGRLAPDNPGLVIPSHIVAYRRQELVGFGDTKMSGHVKTILGTSDIMTAEKPMI